MIWNARFTHTDYPHGATRLKRVFAFKPTYIDGKIIWLATYEVLQSYQIRTIVVLLDPSKPNEGTEFKTGAWIDISKRLITKQ